MVKNDIEKTEKPKGNQGKISFFKRLYVLKHGRFPIKEKTQESLTVRALNAQIALQEKTIEKQIVFMTELEKRIELNVSEDIQTKAFRLAEKFLIPKAPEIKAPEIKNPRQTTLTAEAKNVDVDSQLKQILSEQKPEDIRMALLKGDNFLFKQIKLNYPNMEKQTIFRGIELAREIYGQE